MEVMFFPNGNTACFDEAGQQVPKLQRSYLGLYCELLNSEGIKPEKVKFIMPNGKEARVFKTEYGWNWEI